MYRTSLLFYLVVALGLFAYIMLIDRKNEGTGDIAQDRLRLFEDFDSDKVTDLAIHNKNGDFAFKRDGHRWNLLAPIHAPADPTVISEILDQIHATKPIDNIEITDSTDPETQAQLKDWGLFPTPESRVEFQITDTDGKAKSYELFLGRGVTASTSVYARCSERKNAEVKLVDANLKTVIDKDLSTFRSRRVLDFDINDATQMGVSLAGDATHPAADFHASLDTSKPAPADGTPRDWTLEKPLMTRASGGAVSSMLNELQTLQCITFVSDDPTNLSTYGLAAPEVTFTVTINGADKKPMDLVLQIGSTVPGHTDQVYAQRVQSTSLFTLNKASVEQIVARLPDLRDRHILDITPGGLTGISYDLNGKKLDVQRGKSTWTLTGDPDAVADSMKMVDIGEKLSSLESTPLIKDSPTDLKPFGLDKPTGTLTISSADLKPPTLTITLGKTENHLTYLRTSTSPTVYSIPDTALDFLPKSDDEVHSTNVLMLDLQKVQRMTVQPPKGPPIHLDRTIGGTWTAPELKTLMVDSTKAEEQASLVTHVHAQTWLGPVIPAYGLDKPALSVTVELSGSAPITLNIGASLPNGSRAAQLAGAKDVFSLSEGDYGILSTACLKEIPSVMQLTPTPAPLATTSPTPTPAKH